MTTYHPSQAPEKLEMVIDEEYIKRGDGGNPNYCAFALAAYDLFGLDLDEGQVEVDGDTIRITWTEERWSDLDDEEVEEEHVLTYCLPPEATQWIKDFDQYKDWVDWDKRDDPPVPAPPAATFVVEKCNERSDS